MLRGAGVIALTVLAIAIFPAQAVAGEIVVCPPGTTNCYIVIDEPGGGGGPGSDPGGSGGSPAEPVCRKVVSGDPVDCYSEVFGWWNNEDGCYYLLVDTPPPPTDPAWEGHYPDGAIYRTMCFEVQGTAGGWVWRASPPPGYGGGAPTPEQLAAQAVKALGLLGPDIGLAPDPAKTGLVGLPVWMWTTVSPATWGPVSATASVPGLSVTATAQATRIVWDMGDGNRVTCAGPGTPYTVARGEAGQTTSPTCGHLYTESSAGQPGDAYPITATTTWDIAWSGGGASGQLTQTRSSTTSVRIGELQVLVS